MSEKKKFTNFVYVFLGTITLILGIVGIVVPGLPTTPFLLLTAGLYIKGSERLYRLLISNKVLGAYINDYRRKKGMTVKDKVRSLGLMWTMISVSCIFFIDTLTVRLIVIGVGFIGTIVMGFIVKTVEK